MTNKRGYNHDENNSNKRVNINSGNVLKRGRNDFDESENNEFQPDYETGTYKPKRAALRVDNDETEVPNIMEMSDQDRIKYVSMNKVDAFNYPQHYKDLIKREIGRRDLQGFENLKNITYEKVFQRTAEQQGKLTRIQNLRNVNCIKSRDMSEIDMNNFEYSEKAREMFKNNGVEIPPNLYDYIEFNHGSNLETENYEETIEKYNQEFTNNRYTTILETMKLAFGDLSQYVCVAGGFALSMYIYQNYGYSVGFSDIDLFVHTCDQETANEIIERLVILTGNEEILINDNVISTILKWDDVENNIVLPGLLKIRTLLSNDYITYPSINMTIQIIKRLYTCPQQVITGFDVDSCCILTTLEGQIYTTERGYNAIERGYNVINFDRYSPSYMYRLLKYNKRGFGIWIPFMSQFKDNAVFDINILDKKRGSSILIKNLMGSYSGKNESDYNRVKCAIDTNSREIPKYYKNYKKSYIYNFTDQVIFDTLDVTKQTINTFNRQFIYDPKSWYPSIDSKVQDFVPDIKGVGHELVKLNQTDGLIIYAKNIKRTKKIYDNNKVFYSDNGSITQDYTMLNSSTNFLKYIQHLLPDIITCGYLPQIIMTNNLRNYFDRKYIFYSPMLVDMESKVRFSYELVKYRSLISIYNNYKFNYYQEYGDGDNFNPNINELNLNDIGSIKFYKIVNKELILDLPTTDEENYENFKTLFINDKIFSNDNRYNHNNNIFFKSRNIYGEENIDNLLKKIEYIKNNFGIDSNEYYYAYYNYFNHEPEINSRYNFLFVPNEDFFNLNCTFSSNINVNIVFLDATKSFEEELDTLSEEHDRAFIVQGDNFFGQNYEYQRTMYNINSYGTEILDYPVVDNYVPS